GTPHYMSPEQARGVEVDLRTDIFSLGAVLYEMVTKRTPFEGETSTDLLAEILKTEPPPIWEFAPDAPAELQRIITKAMRKKRDERYSTARDLHLDLKSLKRDVKYRTTLIEHPTLMRIEFDAPEGDFSTKVIEPIDAGKTMAIPRRLASLLLGGKSRVATLFGLPLMLLAIGAAGLFYSIRTKPVLAGRDTILIADFENKTGDPVFDGT